MSPVIPEPLNDRALADLARASNNAVTAMSPEGIITAWNPAAERIYGYSESEAVGRHIDMLMPEDRLQEAREVLARAAAQDRVEHFPTRRRTRDGRIIDVKVTASVLRGPGDEVAGFVASSYEIGAEERLRQRLEHSEAQLNAAQELTGVGSWEFSLDDRVMRWSPQFFRIMGQDPDDFEPTEASALELGHPDDRDDVLATLRRAVTERQSFTCRWRLRAQRGRGERLLEARGRAVVGQDGMVASIVGSAQDVTDAEAARQALQEAEERFRMAFAEAPMAMALIDLEGRYRQVNAAQATLLGRPAAELVGTLRLDHVNDGDRGTEEEGMQRLLDGAIPSHSAEIGFAAAGRDIRVVARMSLVRDPDGTPRHFVCQAQDVTDRHRAEAALRESEARLRSILDALPAVVFIKDLEGRYTLVNRTCAETAGTTVEAVVGTRAEDQFDPERAAEYVADDAALLERPEPQTAEREFPVGGDLRTYRVTKFPLLDERGRPYAIGGIAVDVTERRRERDELLESRALLNEAQRIGQVGSFIWDPVSDTARWSEEQFRIYGRPFSPGPISFEEAMASVHPDDREEVTAVVRRAVAERGRFSMTYRLLWPDGTVRTVRSRGEVSMDPRRQSDRMLGTTQDITRELEREAEIRRLARRNEVVLGSVGEGICGIDRGGRTTFVNDAGARLLGWTDGELIGTDLHEAAYHTGPDGTRRPRDRSPILATARDGRERAEAVDSLWRRDGSRLPVELTCRPTYDEGELTGAVITFRDVTEREAADRQLQEMVGDLRSSDEERRRLLAHLVTAQEDERRRIAADIHDDSVQAMSAVALGLEALRERLPGEERRGSAVDRLHESVVVSVGRLRSLLFELAPPELEHGDLASAIDELLVRLGQDAGCEHEILDELIGEPSIDSRLILYRIAQEAVTNVRKHARASRVSVRLAGKEDGVCLRIRDDGVGFDAGGAGRAAGHLGLLAMRYRAELVGGTFALDSRRGAGTTVTAWIPEPQ